MSIVSGKITAFSLFQSCFRRAVTIVKKLAPWLFTIAVLAVLILFCVGAKRYIPVFLQGVGLWATCVLPASLPFLFLTTLLHKTGGAHRLEGLLSPVSKALFHLSGGGAYCLLLSILCGYPVGAKSLAECFSHGKKVLRSAARSSQKELTVIAALCSTSSPLFILGSVGAGLFQSQKIGLILLISHLFVVFISGMGARFFLPKDNSFPLPSLEKSNNILYDSMYPSVLSALCVGGFICVFFTLSALLSDVGFFSPFYAVLSFARFTPLQSEGLCRGLIEMTGGCGLLSQAPSPLSIALCGFLITFGGASILFQQLCFLQPLGVNTPLFVAFKFLQGIACGAVCFILCLFL